MKNWLEAIGLGHHADMFARNRIDLDVLSNLTEADLVELGLPFGDRKRLLRAIATRSGATAMSGPAATVPTTVGRAKAAAVAERRQLTVLFCDMAGSTELSEQLDPEDLRDLIATYRALCVRAVTNYEGFVAQYQGDGIMVYFGYPQAHEDDAERAVRAGLEIARTISMQSNALPGPSGAAPAVRIAIATGVVVVGDVVGEGTEEHDSAVGETPNLVARLQEVAPLNSVVISQSTRALLKGNFEYEDLGRHSLKGFSAPMQVWRVVRPRATGSRFAGTAGAILTPLVGREEEIALLLKRWQLAKEGDGQVIVLSGEPGIGKSRIVQEFRKRIANELYGPISLQCSPYYTGTAFYPFVEQLKLTIGFDRESSTELLLNNLEAIVKPAAEMAGSATVLFAALLSLPTGDRYPPLELAPQRQKNDTVYALMNHFVALAREQPAVMIFEDCHWIDPSSREVLDLMVDSIENVPTLIIITCRPEFQPSWNSQSHITTLTLNRLSRKVGRVMVEGVAGTKTLPEEVIEAIIAKTDGVPLFIEELTTSVLESSLMSEQFGRYVLSIPLRRLAIPATLTDSLMARLDRMAPFKEVAQVGATIGREFSYELLHAVSETPPDQIDIALDRLESAGLIFRRGHPPQATYTFKHALLQEAAQTSLLHSDKRRLHVRIAAVLAEIYPDKTAREPELLAHHLTEAGESGPAVDFWLKAGRNAAKSHANLEAIAHLRRGLEVLRSDAKIPGRDVLELDLHIALGRPLIAAKGYAVPEVEEIYLRALELVRKSDEKSEVFEAMQGLWVCYFIRGDLAKAHDLGIQLLEIAEQTHLEDNAEQAHKGTGQLIEAHRMLGQTMLYYGRFAAARDHLERGIALYDPQLHSFLVEAHGIDPGIICLSYFGYVQWFLGFPDQARDYSERALSNAEKIGHPFTLAFALAFRAYLCQHLRDVEGTWNYAQRALTIASEHGFLHWSYQAKILRGWALVELGQIDDGLEQIRTGLHAYEATESKLACPWFRSLLSIAYVKASQPEAALRELDEALSIAIRNEEHFFLAEIYRLQGEIALMHRGQEVADQVESCFKRSLDVCRKQKALSWELRTSVSLARFWRDHGKRHEAADLLALVCRKFEQGSDTLDVKEAVQLSSELEVC